MKSSFDFAESREVLKLKQEKLFMDSKREVLDCFKLNSNTLLH